MSGDVTAGEAAAPGRAEADGDAKAAGRVGTALGFAAGATNGSRFGGCALAKGSPPITASTPAPPNPRSSTRSAPRSILMRRSWTALVPVECSHDPAQGALNLGVITRGGLTRRPERVA